MAVELQVIRANGAGQGYGRPPQPARTYPTTQTTTMNAGCAIVLKSVHTEYPPTDLGTPAPFTCAAGPNEACL
jgi:hypothetical protein